MIDIRKEIWHGRRGGRRANATHDYTRVFEVFTTDLQDGTKTVLDEITTIVDVGDVYTTDTETDTDSVCFDIIPEQDSDNGFKWTVRVEYTGKNPLHDEPDESWDTIEIQEPVIVDINGLAVLNSAGEPYSPVPTRRSLVKQLTHVRNEPDPWDDSEIENFVNHVNDDTFYGASAGYALCTRISARKRNENGLTFWVVTRVFQFRKEDGAPPDYPDWQLYLIDAGLRALNGASGLKNIEDKVRGGVISRPALLDGNGNAIADQDPANAVYNSFALYPSADFSALGL